MATSRRGENSGIGWSEIESTLRLEPFKFSFFQAVRLLERLAKERKSVGGFVKPSTEAVRFAASASLDFPASEIQSLTWETEDGAPRLEVNFIGLSGPLGTLPLYYTDLLMSRIRADDLAMRDFFDIFNHRIVSLLYRAWEKHRPTVTYEHGGRDRFSGHVLALVGLGTLALQERQYVADDSLIYYSGLLGLQARSATGLKQILSDYFDVAVVVEQFVGSWYRLDSRTQCYMDSGTTASEQLGLGVVLGDEIWDHQSVVRIRLGPLTLAQYHEFLPGGDAYKALGSLTRFISGDEIDFEVQLILARNEVPPCELGNEGPKGPLLGWVSWMKSVPFLNDAKDTVFKI